MPTLGSPPMHRGYSSESTSALEVTQSRGTDILRIIIMQKTINILEHSRGKLGNWGRRKETASERRLWSPNFGLRRGVGVSSSVGCRVHSPSFLWEPPMWPKKWPCSTSALNWLCDPTWFSQSQLQPTKDSESCPSLVLAAGFSLKMSHM